MPRRAASPTPSENEVDILWSLYGNGELESATAKGDLDLDLGGILDVAEDGEDGEDGGDEAFIALKQAASFRKVSNLKGNTVKKGGGFQAMGKSHPPVCSWVSGSCSPWLTPGKASMRTSSGPLLERGFLSPRRFSASPFP